MQATTNRLTVKDALALTNRHVASRTVIPVLSNVLLEADHETQTITITATDLDGTSVIGFAGDVETSGRVLVDRKTLAATVKTGDPVAGFRLGVDGLEVDTGATVTLPAGPMDDYPSLPNMFPGTPYVLTAEDRETLGTVARFASDDVGRPVLTGVKIDGGKAAATDSYRLGVGDVSPELPEMLVPARYVRTVAGWKIDDTSVGHGCGLYVGDPDSVNPNYAGRYVSVHGNVANGPKRARRELRVGFAFRTLDGTFPNYRMLMPEPANVDLEALWVHVDRDATLRAVKNLQGIARTPNTAVRLAITADRVTFTVHDEEHGTGTADVVARVQGPGFTVPTDVTGPVDVSGDVPTFATNYNPVFLAGQLDAMPAGPVAITLRDGLKPGRFDHVDTSLTGLLMPMRVS